MPGNKHQEKGKRPAQTPTKPHQQSNKLMKKSLDFNTDSESMDTASGSPSSQDGGAHGPVVESLHQLEQPPQWFIDFERRQEVRFTNIIKDVKDICDGFKHDIDNVKDEIKTLQEKLDLTEAKLDDLENRGRRNNIVIYNLPEGVEGARADCIEFMSDLIVKECNIERPNIQRAHRTGRISVANHGPGSHGTPKSRPRPIHVGFNTFQEKESCRKALVGVFKQNKLGYEKLYVANDYSQKVLKLRKEKLPQLRKLKSEGKNAFFVYPAFIKVREPSGVVRDA